MTLRLLLVRHGLSSFNLERRIQGRDDLSNLTESGHEQARCLGASLADVPLDAVYSSRLQRAAATTASLIEARGASDLQDFYKVGGGLRDGFLFALFFFYMCSA